MKHEFHFHEDEPGQEQVLPIEWWSYCEGEFEGLRAHDDAHYDPDSGSWGALYQFSEADPNLPELSMTEARFIELLEPHCKQFDKVIGSLAEFDELHGIRAVGFGPPDGGGIIADLKDDQLTSIWGRIYALDSEQMKTMINLLTALSTDQHLMLVDWGSHKTADLRDRAQIEAYLRGD